MGHPEQLQPQEDFPFFLFFTMCMTISVITAASTRQIAIVLIFAHNHVSILLPLSPKKDHEPASALPSPCLALPSNKS